MFGIPAPPQPLWSQGVAYGVAGGCLVAGVLILLWGRYLGRAFLCVVGMAVGLALGRPLAERLGVNPTAIRIAAAIVIALLMLGLARVIWALLTAGLFAIAAECIVLVRCLGEMSPESCPVFQAADPTFACWAIGVGRFSLHAFAALWTEHIGLVMAAIFPAAALPLVLGLLRPRVVRIFMTSLLGGAAAVLGPIVALAQLRPPLWESIWGIWYVPLAAAGALMVFGLVWQYRGAIRSDRAKEESEAEQADEGELKSSAGKTRKKR